MKLHPVEFIKYFVLPTMRRNMDHEPTTNEILVFMIEETTNSLLASNPDLWTDYREATIWLAQNRDTPL